jgi:hypothetical protein
MSTFITRILTMAEHQAHQNFAKAIDTPEFWEWKGKDPLCIIAILPDGPPYADALAEYLDRKHGVKANKTLMDDEGNYLELEELVGCKCLLVDNDTVTGRTLKKTVAEIRSREKDLDIKGVEYAVYTDRANLVRFRYESRHALLEDPEGLLWLNRKCMWCGSPFSVQPTGAYGDVLLKIRCCPKCRRHIASSVSSIRRVFRETGEVELSLEAITGALHALHGPGGGSRYTPERVKRILESLDLGVEVRPDHWRFNPTPRQPLDNQSDTNLSSP